MWLLIDRFGIVIGIIIGLVTFYAYYQATLGRERRRQKRLNSQRKNPGRHPGILIVDLSPQVDMEFDVENFRQQQDHLKDIPKEHIFTITRNVWVKPTDVPGLIDEVRRTKLAIQQAGIDVVHYFYGGPVGFPPFIGGEFVNARRVIVYHRKLVEGEVTYESWGPLRHPHI